MIVYHIEVTVAAKQLITRYVLILVPEAFYILQSYILYSTPTPLCFYTV